MLKVCVWGRCLWWKCLRLWYVQSEFQPFRPVEWSLAAVTLGASVCWCNKCKESSVTPTLRVWGDASKKKRMVYKIESLPRKHWNLLLICYYTENAHIFVIMKIWQKCNYSPLVLKAWVSLVLCPVLSMLASKVNMVVYVCSSNLLSVLCVFNKDCFVSIFLSLCASLQPQRDN